MSLIPKDIFPAVMFARRMMREGTPAGLAIYKSARYYKVPQHDVAVWANGYKEKGLQKNAEQRRTCN